MTKDKARLLRIWHLLNLEVALLRDASDTPAEKLADVLQAQQLIHRVLHEHSATDDPGEGAPGSTPSDGSR